MLSRNKVFQSACGLIIAGLIAAAGCSRPYTRISDSEQELLASSAIGAAGGAAIGALTGAPATGAIVGGGVGAVTEYLDDDDDR